MSTAGGNDDRRPVNRGRAAWEDAQRSVRERNEAARQAAKQQRADDDRRQASAQRERYERDGVYR